MEHFWWAQKCQDNLSIQDSWVERARYSHSRFTNPGPDLGIVELPILEFNPLWSSANFMIQFWEKNPHNPQLSLPFSYSRAEILYVLPRNPSWLSHFTLNRWLIMSSFSLFFSSELIALSNSYSFHSPYNYYFPQISQMLEMLPVASAFSSHSVHPRWKS